MKCVWVIECYNGKYGWEITLEGLFAIFSEARTRMNQRKHSWPEQKLRIRKYVPESK